MKRSPRKGLYRTIRRVHGDDIPIEKRQPVIFSSRIKFLSTVMERIAEGWVFRTVACVNRKPDRDFN